MLRCAGLMAGGNGSRLRASGITVPKPLLQVKDRPLVSYFLDQAAEVGIERVVAAVRAADQVVPSFLAQDTRFEWEFVETDGKGTHGAVRALTEALGADDHLISTCDVVLPPGCLGRFLGEVDAARDRDPVLMLLASETIHGRRPIWLETGVGDPRRVVRFGRDLSPTGLVFGHIRWASRAMRSTLKDLPWKDITQDTKFMSMFADLTEYTILQYSEPGIRDVNDADDIVFTEKRFS
jgi:NDP-sugar pyrophosphorylase family protein